MAFVSQSARGKAAVLTAAPVSAEAALQTSYAPQRGNARSVSPHVRVRAADPMVVVDPAERALRVKRVDRLGFAPAQRAVSATAAPRPQVAATVIASALRPAIAVRMRVMPAQAWSDRVCAVHACRIATRRVAAQMDAVACVAPVPKVRAATPGCAARASRTVRRRAAAQTGVVARVGSATEALSARPRANV